jgi:hypothetical protein
MQQDLSLNQEGQVSVPARHVFFCNVRCLSFHGYTEVAVVASWTSTLISAAWTKTRPWLAERRAETTVMPHSMIMAIVSAQCKSTWARAGSWMTTTRTMTTAWDPPNQNVQQPQRVTYDRSSWAIISLCKIS